MPAPDWYESLEEFWAKAGFEPSGKSLVLGVSGGADSVALLELFARVVAPRRGCRLHAVHVNHRLRPEAGLDQVLVEELCRDRGVPLHVEALDPGTRRARQSAEMWGREHRYAAFARAASRFGSSAILTAHHRDDAVETLLLRLWRGTGLAGLAGIPFLRADGIVRPLLPVGRAELRAWLARLGTPWREDASNADERVPRNWIRRRLLPAWRARDRDLDERAFRLARQVEALLPAWGRWMAAEHPLEEVLERGGIPIEWLRAGMEPASLKILLPALGIETPAPETMAEILRQAGAPGGSIRVRVDERTVLAEKGGILVAVRAHFRR